MFRYFPNSQITDDLELNRYFLFADKPGVDRMGIGGGAIVTASGDNDVDYVCRIFAPSEAIDQDAATGSIQCTLVPYWAERAGQQTFRVQQLSPRGARMWCTLVGDRVKIAGEVQLYLQGTINI